MELTTLTFRAVGNIAIGLLALVAGGYLLASGASLLLSLSMSMLGTGLCFWGGALAAQVIVILLTED